MNKKDLIKTIAEDTWMSQKYTSLAINSLIQIIKYQLVNWEKVTVTWLGSFETIVVSAKNWVNPITKEKMVIPSMSRVKFKPSTELKKSVKNIA